MDNDLLNKTTTIIGYIGQKNTGDDSFLLVSSFAAEKYLAPQKPIFTLSPIVPNTLNIDVKAINMPFRFPGSGVFNRMFTKRCFKKTNHVVFAGGSIFHSAGGLRKNIALLDMARPGLRFAVGVSVGPFRDPEAPELCASLLSRLDFIGVRDPVSLERVKAICPTANVELTFDLAPLLPYFFDLHPKKRWEGGRLGVSLCNYERFVGGAIETETERIKRVAEALNDSFFAGAFKELVLLDFNGHETMGDRQVHIFLKSLLKRDIPITHYGYSNNPLDFLGIISDLDALIGMRLHSNIFAFCTKTPTIMLAYHEKCYEWGRITGIPPSFIFDSQGIETGELSKSIQSMFSDPGKAKPCKITYEEAVKLSLKNWIWIKEK